MVTISLPLELTGVVEVVLCPSQGQRHPPLMVKGGDGGGALSILRHSQQIYLGPGLLGDSQA